MCNFSNPFTYTRGESPLLVSFPHSGTSLIPGMKQDLTQAARSLPDTDWHLPELYHFLSEMNVSTIAANYSRYVVDLNRPVDDKPLYQTKTTGLFPDILFADKPVFLEGKRHSDAIKAQIKQDIWHPYHQKIINELTRIKAQFGYAILFEAHSIASQVPMLFDGKLPDFNFGNNDGEACTPELLPELARVVANSKYSHICNGRFKGGYITRHFGQPEFGVHAIQLELSQDTYLSGSSGYQMDTHKQQQVTPILRQLIETLLKAGNKFQLKNNVMGEQR